MPSIIETAKYCGADAIYPGYGFLAENAEFAEACINSGLIFIGPSAEAIRKMGDKAEARQTMYKAGVPVVPGTESIIDNLTEAKKIAKQIGYPILIKASAGGGGKGMRIVNEEKELDRALRQASQEAERSFGNRGVYIEKYLTSARHIEIQIMADNFENTVYLVERDCNTQRRHQKLLEEAPSLIVDEKMRTKMGKAAVRAAKAAFYSGAGTVEFIVDQDKNFYFMEMNTRIQVEHPITEAITGIDLVKTQILVASGVKLPWKQKDIKLRGWAIECRINAEDCYHNFIPFPGQLITYKPPQIENVRIDSAVYEGYIITPFYDSMIAKVIALATDRKKAISLILEALKDFKIEGVKTTISLHYKLLVAQAFQKGIIDTNYLELHLEDILKQ